MRVRAFIQRTLLSAVAIVMAAINPGAALAKENVVEARPDAVEAYIYGYPLVTMEMTRRVMTNVEKPEGTRPRWASSCGCANIRARPFAT